MMKLLSVSTMLMASTRHLLSGRQPSVVIPQTIAFLPALTSVCAAIPHTSV
jgi:hypothetical protein